MCSVAYELREITRRKIVKAERKLTDCEKRKWCDVKKARGKKKEREGEKEREKRMERNREQGEIIKGKRKTLKMRAAQRRKR